MPEVALQPIRVARILSKHPSEKHVDATLAGVLQEPLAQIDVVASDPLGNFSMRADSLQEKHARTSGRNHSRDIGFGQANRRLDSRSGRKVWEERRLDWIGNWFNRSKPADRSHLG
jgi:hypothetical protein